MTGLQNNPIGVFLSCCLVFFACSTKIERIEERYEAGSAKRIVVYEVKENSKHNVFETDFYPNGNKKMAGALLDNKRHGVWKSWYSNGTLWSEGNYASGVREGVAKTYHENGTLHLNGFYKNDDATGTWLFHDSTGTLIKKIDYSKRDEQAH
jgi:antitoxin component YwqK of YwqJK toxin-antitoxin module